MTAVQRTADRDTIRELLNSAQHAPMGTHDQDGACTVCPVPLYECGPDEIADALAAVLVPADLIRAEAIEGEAERIRTVTKQSAEAQRASDLHEGLPLIGTSTANEVEWYQMGNWAEGLLRARAAEYRKAAGA